MINWTEETYPEPTQSEIRTAGMVLIVRTLANGDTLEEWLVPLNAISEAMFGSLNGREVVSSRVVLGDVSVGTSGISGSAMCVEWSTVRHLGYDLGLG